MAATAPAERDCLALVGQAARGAYAPTLRKEFFLLGGSTHGLGAVPSQEAFLTASVDACDREAPACAPILRKVLPLLGGLTPRARRVLFCRLQFWRTRGRSAYPLLPLFN